MKGRSLCKNRTAPNVRGDSHSVRMRHRWGAARFPKKSPRFAQNLAMGQGSVGIRFLLQKNDVGDSAFTQVGVVIVFSDLISPKPLHRY